MRQEKEFSHKNDKLKAKLMSSASMQCVLNSSVESACHCFVRTDKDSVFKAFHGMIYESTWLRVIPTGRSCQQEGRDPAKLWAQAKGADLLRVPLNLTHVSQLSGITISIKAAVFANVRLPGKCTK